MRKTALLNILGFLCFFAVFTFHFGGKSILAWVNPASPAPDGNVGTPLNPSSTDQTKFGPLASGKLSVNDWVTACCADYYTFSINEGAVNEPALQFSKSDSTDGHIILRGSIDDVGRGFIFQGSGATIGARFTGNVSADGTLTGPLFSLKDAAASGAAGRLQWYAQNKTTLNHYFYEDRTNNDQLGLYLANNSSADNKLAVKNGGLAVPDGSICLGGQCRNTWPRDFTPENCPEGQSMTGISPDKQIICADAPDFYWTPGPCSDTLPGSNKKIFVTGTAILGSSLSQDNANNLCQNLASEAGHLGIFKALVFFGSSGQKISEILPAGHSFWNGGKAGFDGSQCLWNLIAKNPIDFFQADTAGNYIENPIKFTEAGLEVNNLTVWTGFKPTGNGNYSTTDPLQATWGVRSGACVKKCNGACQTGKYSFTSWTYTGRTSQTDVNWAGTYTGWESCVSASGCSAVGNMSMCTGNSWSLYCVEQ